MVESFFRVSLKEIASARLVCAKCGTATEIGLQRLAVDATLACPGCKETLGSNELSNFAKYATTIQATAERAVAVEFLIPIAKA